jgi:hypothetical protein
MLDTTGLSKRTPKNALLNWVRGMPFHLQHLPSFLITMLAKKVVAPLLVEIEASSLPSCQESALLGALD